MANFDSGIRATVLKDSISESGFRLVTFLLKGPKFLDAEHEKHRMAARSSSSDRAVPTKRLIDSEFFLPVDVRLNEPGMQGSKFLSDEELLEFHTDLTELRKSIIDVLDKWKKVHKQHLNRYLIPFSFQYKVLTLNYNWLNYFFSLRKHEAADPAMIEQAKVMQLAVQESKPVLLKYRQWHLPFLTPEEEFSKELSTLDKIKMSAARCGRSSYMNHDKTYPTKTSDLERADGFIKDVHLVPFEHQATPIGDNKQEFGITVKDLNTLEYGSGCLRGWIQARHKLGRDKLLIKG